MARIRLQTLINAPIERVFDLARDIDLHQDSMAHTREKAVRGRTTGLIDLGEIVEWRARQFGLTWTLAVRITQFERPTRFVDEQVKGPFARFRHEHRFETTDAGTLMTDLLDVRSPLGPLGRAADLVVVPQLRRQLEIRNAALKRAAEASSPE